PAGVLRVAAGEMIASARYRPGFCPRELTLFNPVDPNPASRLPRRSGANTLALYPLTTFFTPTTNASDLRAAIRSHRITGISLIPSLRAPLCRTWPSTTGVLIVVAEKARKCKHPTDLQSRLERRRSQGGRIWSVQIGQCGSER